MNEDGSSKSLDVDPNIATSSENAEPSSSADGKDIDAALEKLLGSGGDLELVQSSSGEVRLVPKNLISKEQGECPKCKEIFETRSLLQRHQCPVLTLFNTTVAVTCPKCKATFVKRSLLERHRCPALLYPEMNQESSEPPTKETSLNSQDLSNNSRESENLEIGNNTPFSGNSEIIVSCKACKEDFTSLEDLQVHSESCQVITNTIVTDAKEHTKESEGENELSALNETSEFPVNLLPEQPENEESALSKMSPEMIELHSQILEDTAEISVIDTSDLENTPSSIRRSSRAAGKVNPILERLKKKSRASVEEQTPGTSSKNNAENEEQENKEQDSSVIVKRKRGRPPKIRPAESPGNSIKAIEKLKTESATPKRGRGRPKKRGPGRPRKYKIVESDVENSEEEYVDRTYRGAIGVESEENRNQRRSDRPRKLKILDSYDEESEEDDEEVKRSSTVKSESSRDKIEPNTSTHVGIVKRKRGRPRKIPIELHQEKEPNKIIENEDTTKSPGDKETIGNSQEKETIGNLENEDEGEMKSRDNEKEGSMSETQTKETPIKRKRGRPKKIRDSEQEMEKKTETLEGVRIKEEDGEKENRQSSSQLESGKGYEAWGENDDELGEQSDIEENSEERLSESFEIKVEGESVIRESSHKKESECWCEKCERSFSCLVALKKHKLTRIHKRGVNTSQNRKFICPVCGRGFMRIDHLRDHQVNHTGAMQHQCIICKKRFKFRSQLALHRNTDHTESELAEAMQRNPQFMMRGRYKGHHSPPGDAKYDPKYQPEIIESLEDKSPIFRCKVCNQVFSEARLFNRHIISHFPEKPFKCDICAKEFSRADTLRCHKKIHYGFSHGELGTFLCDTCGRQFKKVEQLKSHVKVHFDERTWRCEVCGKCFMDKYTLARHIIIHKSQKPWLCATCGRGFNRRAHLEAHEAQHTGKTLYNCEICQRGFSDQGNLGRHMLVHSQERPWSCSICGDTFKRKGNLDEHVLTHNIERRAVCTTCGARFTTKRYLRIHQLIHSGDRPHKCMVCNATFRQLSALITHKRIHTGDAPYKCTHCEKRFKYYDQWKAHEYGHSDAKPYKCMLCSATYRQAGSLRQHRKLVHGNQKGMVFLCTVCNKTFASTMSLERHMKKIHGAEASLQSLQAISHEAMTATTSGETPNIVQITNPQGAIETIELANLPEDGTTNYVHLLSGQTLANLQSEQVTMTNQSGVQLTDGQRIVQFVRSLDESGQVMEVAGENGQQVIHIDNMANIQNQEAVVSEADTVLQYDPNVPQETMVQITDAHAFVNAVSDSHTTQSITEALSSVAQVSPPPTDGQIQEVQTITVSADGETSYVVTIPQDLNTITNMEHQMVSNTSLVPIEVVPIETTVTTLETSEHSELVTMETQETIHELDPEDTDVITETLTHELPEEEVVETVSIATTYDTVPNV